MMNTPSDQFDPWGPVSSILYEINDSDFVQDAIANAGVAIAWRELTRDEAYSHSTRIRARRREISSAYADLGPNEKALFAQVVVKSMLRRPDGEDIRAKLIDRLSDIGWSLSQDGQLTTKDALVSEQFFPLNSTFDAYVAIREVLSTASTEIIIVDAYIGTSLLQTLRALPDVQPSKRVKILTVAKNLKPDFGVELDAFIKQVVYISIEIRTTADFHDRFIVIDGNDIYHVGASIKDAGNRAFMISRLRDQPNINNTRKFIQTTWDAARPYST